MHFGPTYFACMFVAIGNHDGCRRDCTTDRCWHGECSVVLQRFELKQEVHKRRQDLAECRQDKLQEPNLGARFRDFDWKLFTSYHRQMRYGEFSDSVGRRMTN